MKYVDAVRLHLARLLRFTAGELAAGPDERARRRAMDEYLRDFEREHGAFTAEEMAEVRRKWPV